MPRRISIGHRDCNARALLAVIVLFAVFAAVDVGAVTNGDFEQGGNGWFRGVAGPDPCSPPVVVRGLNLPNPPGAKPGANSLAWLGNFQLGALGCNPSTLFQNFWCALDTTDQNWCTVTFDASLWLAPGEQAVVIQKSYFATRAGLIPGGGAPASGRYSISVKGCNENLILFAVVNPLRGQGVKSILQIDNVQSTCSSGDSTSANLPMIPLPSAGLGIELLDRDGVPVTMSTPPLDCDVNGLFDHYEIDNALASDDNGNGTIDACDPKPREINWVLMGVGLLMIFVTVRRMIRNRPR